MRTLLTDVRRRAGQWERDHCKISIPVYGTVCMACARDVDPIVS